jgi:hypothetical protein
LVVPKTELNAEHTEVAEGNRRRGNRVSAEEIGSGFGVWGIGGGTVAHFNPKTHGLALFFGFHQETLPDEASARNTIAWVAGNTGKT